MKIKDLLHLYPKPKPGKSSRKGIRDDEIRASYMINAELLNKIKSLAYWERNSMGRIIEKAVMDYVYKKESIELKNPPKKRTGDKDTGTTFIIKKEVVDKIKALAYWEKETIKMIFDKALKSYINKYESEKGPIKQKPEM